MNIEDWRVLVDKASRMQFSGAEQRAIVRKSLLGIARELADDLSGTFSEEIRDERVLWAAMRRYASMIDVADGEQLDEFVDAIIEFLSRDDLPRTQQAALLCIENVFSAHPLPPEHQNIAYPLREKVLKIASDYLGPNPPELGRDTAIDLNTLFALAVLDVSQLPNLLEKTRETKTDWFYPVARRRLRALHAKCTWEPTHLTSILFVS